MIEGEEGAEGIGAANDGMGGEVEDGGGGDGSFEIGGVGLGAFEEGDLGGREGAGYGFDFGCGAGEPWERGRVWDLGKVLWVGDEDEVWGELAGSGFVLFGVAEEPSGGDSVRA